MSSRASCRVLNLSRSVYFYKPDGKRDLPVIHLEFIKPGKPTQNSFVERFNRTFREEILNYYIFKELKEVRELTENWLREYNTERPHESLQNRTPIEYLKLTAGNSNNPWP